MVQLYERGYGKDSAGIAMEAIASGMLEKLEGAFCMATSDMKVIITVTDISLILCPLSFIIQKL